MDGEQLALRMRAVARSLAEPCDLGETLSRVVQAALSTVPGASAVSVTLRRGDDRLETLASTSDLVRQLDDLQYDLREGPCYEAVTDGPLSWSPDVQHDPRWPRFGPRAAELGFGSQLAVRMLERAGAVTGLNLYSDELGAFDPHDGLAQLFASHAAIALGYAQRVENLSSALQTREMIGNAVGILAERYGLTPERAFEFLVRLSSTTNTPVRDLAAHLIDEASGRDLPDD